MTEAEYEALGRRITAGLEIPNLPAARLATWFRQIGITASKIKATEGGFW